MPFLSHDNSEGAERVTEGVIVDSGSTKPIKEQLRDTDCQTQHKVPAPEKAKKTVSERLAVAKSLLGDKEYTSYLKKCDLKESDVTEDNISIVIRGMRVRFEELQAKGKAKK
jgi:hypothetical protein